MPAYQCPPDLPPDNPGEHSRAPRFWEPECDDGRATPEMETGPIGVALFLGAPSRAYPTEER